MGRPNIQEAHLAKLHLVNRKIDGINQYMYIYIYICVCMHDACVMHVFIVIVLFSYSQIKLFPWKIMYFLPVKFV